LYERGLYEDGTALLGLAVKIAQRLGLHRDPSHFTFSPWVSEMRRRLWNYLSHLDSRYLEALGGGSCLSALFWDTKPPTNANDGQWEASRFATKSSIPGEVNGFTDMTFAILCGQLANMMRNVLMQTETATLKSFEILLAGERARLHERHLQHLNTDVPFQQLVGVLCEIMMSRLRLIIHQKLVRREKLSGKSKDA
jgi:Fungal specific transcription factor domain